MEAAHKCLTAAQRGIHASLQLRIRLQHLFESQFQLVLDHFRLLQLQFRRLHLAPGSSELAFRPAQLRQQSFIPTSQFGFFLLMLSFQETGCFQLILQIADPASHFDDLGTLLLQRLHPARLPSHLQLQIRQPLFPLLQLFRPSLRLPLQLLSELLCFAQPPSFALLLSPGFS